MNLAELHLLLNHWPIIGSMIALAMFLVSIVGKRDELKQASLALFALIALLAIPTFMSGFAAQEALKESTDVSMDVVQSHEGAALLTFMSMEVAGAFSLFGLWRFSRDVKNPFLSRPGLMNVSAVLLFAVVTTGLMAIAGNTGGDIRHPEILSGQAPISAIGNIGFALVPKIQHFVIDTSMWVWPVLEDLHFLGLILLLGTIGVLNLRILGFLKQIPIAPLHRFIPWGIAGFATNLITGF